MGRSVGAKDLAPVIRRAAMGAVKRLEGKGVSLSYLIEKELERDVLKTLAALAKFNPRQVNVDTQTTIQINEIISVVTARQKEKLIKAEVVQEGTGSLGELVDEPNAIVQDVGHEHSFTPSFTPIVVTVEPST